MLKLLFGFDIDQSSQNKPLKTIHHDLLESTWSNASSNVKNPGLVTRTLSVLKKLVLLAIGLAVGLVMAFFYRQKQGQLH